MSASRCASRLALAVALAVASAVAVAPSPSAAQEQPSSFSHRMAQGRFFLQQRLHQQALHEFEAAAALSDGASDPEVYELIARTRYQLGAIGGAVDAARTAAALQPRMTPTFAEFHEFLTTRFGKVLVIGARMDGAARPEPVSTVLDPEIKRCFEAAMSRLESGGEGSTSVYLPVGSYRVAGHIIEVKPGGATRMDLRPTVGASRAGVYGERRGEGRGASASTPRPATPTPRPVADVGLSAMLYSQQGVAGLGGGLSASGGVLSGPFRLQGGVRLALWRAERIQVADGDVFASGAGPAGAVEGVLAISLLFPGARAVDVGPELLWVGGWTGPFATSLPSGYLGPRGYFVHGPELGARFVFGDPDRRARPTVALRGLVREAIPLGTLLPEDRRPHLSPGVVVDFGVHLR